VCADAGLSENTQKMRRMATLRTVALTTAACAATGVLVAAVVVGAGLYPVAANRPHWQIVYDLLDTALRQSVGLWSRGVTVPDLSSPALVPRGAACFRQHCVQCHGGPGVAQGEIGRSMQPLPGPLVDAHRRWQPGELYWITRNGIRMSGMPAWEFRLPDADLWALVAFMQRLPQMGPAEFAAATAGAATGEGGQPGAGRSTQWATAVAPIATTTTTTTACGFTAAQRDAVPERAPDVARGRRAMAQYACSACHTIPGVSGPAPQVGPPLAGLATRTVIAGKLANTTDNMVRWLRHPQQVDPLTSMPDLQVTEADARDMAAYLATLR
jgi:mono/diheme cytochrome c family protein